MQAVFESTIYGMWPRPISHLTRYNLFMQLKNGTDDRKASLSVEEPLKVACYYLHLKELQLWSF